MNVKNDLSEDVKDNRSRGQRLLDEFKRKEKSTTFHEKRINKNTIVYCKNKERIEDYENSYNNIKNW